MIGFLISTLTQGALYSLVAFGVYISYSVLNFPDLSVDGTFPLGAALTAGLLLRGANPWVALAAAMAAGMLAGAFTGVVHVVFRVRDLLAGIITQTALFSVNLLINGTSNVALERSAKTIFQMGDVLGGMSLGTRRLIVALAIALTVKLLLDLYFRTKSGLLLRAVGDNAALVTALGKNMGAVKILGLALSNGLVALAGGIVCQADRSFTSTMGAGQVVFGLASVIIGISLFRKASFVRATTAVLVGSILYKACIQAAMQLGFQPFMLKFVTAMLFLLVLVLSGRKGETIIRA
ncbi:MAG: ABC transporter permease [Candidatus Faecousia sp.]|nr:ABC transporter permease [Bacillota bacterium]MDY2810501.1 ABC transporter permease [Candidatus Faecousia sp.]